MQSESLTKISSMKKRFLLIFSTLAFVCASCITVSDGNEELEKKISQLQKDVAELQKAVGITPTTTDTQESPEGKEAGEKKVAQPALKKAPEKAEPQSTASVEQQAVEAVKYCLKMYCPDEIYKGIRTVPKSDGTIDVIVDFKQKYTGGIGNTTYNVTVYKGNEYKINDISGLRGYFSYGDKFPMK